MVHDNLETGEYNPNNHQPTGLFNTAHVNCSTFDFNWPAIKPFSTMHLQTGSKCKSVPNMMHLLGRKLTKHAFCCKSKATRAMHLGPERVVPCLGDARFNARWQDESDVTTPFSIHHRSGSADLAMTDLADRPNKLFRKKKTRPNHLDISWRSQCRVSVQAASVLPNGKGNYKEHLPL